MKRRTLALSFVSAVAACVLATPLHAGAATAQTLKTFAQYTIAPPPSLFDSPLTAYQMLLSPSTGACSYGLVSSQPCSTNSAVLDLTGDCAGDVASGTLSVTTDRSYTITLRGTLADEGILAFAGTTNTGDAVTGEIELMPAPANCVTLNPWNGFFVLNLVIAGP